MMHKLIHSFLFRIDFLTTPLLCENVWLVVDYVTFLLKNLE